jgi:SAM-dependent methyltransferase
MPDSRDLKAHWDKVYSDRGADGVSWYQSEPALSLRLIGEAGLKPGDRVVDVGGGASVLVDRLLERGLAVDVLDLSGRALAISRERLAARASAVRWLEQDATRWDPEPGAYALWHDRAVFHFLVDPVDRAGYLDRLKLGLRRGGHLVLAAFAPEGPEKCSGLSVERYGAQGLGAVLGPDFRLLNQAHEVHRTPWDSEQAFLYCLFRKETAYK